jgi:transposase
MGRVSKYPDELRERAVRMVAEVRPQYPSQWAAITAVAGMLGIGTPETLRTWIRRSEVDSGQRPGVTSHMAEENKALRKENAELRRAIVILGWVDCLGVCSHDKTSAWPCLLTILVSGWCTATTPTTRPPE